MDSELVRRARGGGRGGLASLVPAALDGLGPGARPITRGPGRAPGAVQETLIKAWRGLPSLRDVDRFEAWLRQLLVRSCVDELRRRRRLAMEVELIDSMHPQVGDSTVSIADRDALERGFRRLDPEQRVLVVLYYYQGLPLEDVAAALRIPAGTAKSRLSRARDVLRAALEADARVAAPGGVA